MSMNWPRGGNKPSTRLAVFAENLILLRHVEYRGEMRRILAVLKMRFSRHDTRITEYAIEDDRGIVIAGEAPAAEGLLSGMVRVLGDQLPGGGRSSGRSDQD